MLLQDSCSNKKRYQLTFIYYIKIKTILFYVIKNLQGVEQKKKGDLFK